MEGNFPHIAMLPPLPFSEDVEQPPADENQNIAQVVAIMRQLLFEKFKTSGEKRRDVHVKSHGCASGEFSVRNGLVPDLAQGLFAEARSFTAVIRFSNSSPWLQPDGIPDGRGMAVQLEHDFDPDLCLEPAQRTQDFVMVNHPTFIAANVKDYLNLEESRLLMFHQPARLASRMLTAAVHPVQWRCRALWAAARVAGQVPQHPANYFYHSMVPIRFGQYIAKYRVVPISQQPLSLARGLATFSLQRDGMRHLLRETLRQQEIRFEFQVQLRTSIQSMPIEDATVEWPETESPYQTVADLVLPRQDLSNPSAVERRTFNVWNGLHSHRPLGGINRVRRNAYAASAGFRGALTIGRET